jgi:MarR family transcriptional regulator, organic hydroperoxide resistance regulator
VSATDTPGATDAADDTAAPARMPDPETASGPTKAPAAHSVTTDPTTPSGRVGLAFKRAMVATRKLRGREANRPDQLSFAQYGLLFGLAGMCERSARDLAEQADLTPATAAQMLDHLENAGLVKRTRSKQDRRVVLSALTDRGAAVVAERHAQMQPRWQATLSEFSDDELDAAARVLNRLADYFNDVLEDSADHPTPPTVEADVSQTI